MQDSDKLKRTSRIKSRKVDVEVFLAIEKLEKMAAQVADWPARKRAALLSPALQLVSAIMDTDEKATREALRSLSGKLDLRE